MIQNLKAPLPGLNGSTVNVMSVFWSLIILQQFNQFDSYSHCRGCWVKLSQVQSHLDIIHRAVSIVHINLFLVLFDCLVGLVTKYLSQNLFFCDVIEFTQNIIYGHILYLEDTINDDIKKIGKT
jgi:hypothetical protein